MVDVLGMRLGRYEIQERLGRGGMATVYKARDTNLERSVAVKVLHDYLADEADFKQRFEREAKLVAALNHPNIVQIYDSDETAINGQPVYYMVMAYITGQSLRHVMETRHAAGESLTPKEIMTIMESVCGALGYAHMQGMVHRDVTPGNILFNENGTIVLADFGLARLVSGARLTQTGMTTGTPIYMPPEQGMGLPGDSRSDLYSLGVILYEMLTGRAPYEADSAFAIIMKHVNDPVPPLKLLGAPDMSNAPIALAAVVGRALAKNPDQRYQSAEQMLTDFKAAVNGAPLLPAPPIQDSSPLNTGGIRATASSARVLETIIVPAPRRTAIAPITLIGALILVVAALTLVGTGFIARSNTTIAPLEVVTLRVLPTIGHSGGNAMTDSAVFFRDDFATSQRMAWEIVSDDPKITRTFADGVLRIENKLSATAVTTVINPRSAQYGGSTVIESDMTLSAAGQPPSAAGIIFRYVSDDEYYVFAFDAQNRVSIWLRKVGVWTELRRRTDGMQWTPTTGLINPPGQKNHLKLIVDGDHLVGFVNGGIAVEVTEHPAIMGGGVGIYLATTTNVKEIAPFAGVDVATYSVQPFMQAATATPMAKF